MEQKTPPNPTQKKSLYKKLEQLRELIIYHRHKYHTDDTPEISDEAYDALLRELQELESMLDIADELQESKKIGGKILDGFSKTTHQVSQWSYDNVFGFDELARWDERNRKILEKKYPTPALPYVDEGAMHKKARAPWRYACELKIDGLKIVLTYRDGKLIIGATRGDGTVGEDITENIKMIKSIPKTISDKRELVVIGEVWMKKTDLEKINKERIASGLPVYANPRNLAAGTLRQLDTNIVAGRDLQVFCYDLTVLGDENAFETHTEELSYLKKLGFNVNPETEFAETLQDVQLYVDKWIPLRHDKEYGVDGVVIKLDDTSLRADLGYTAKSPRFGVAYKFPAEEVTTVVLYQDMVVFKALAIGAELALHVHFNFLTNKC
jgi:DNA ligase (NAD+)